MLLTLAKFTWLTGPPFKHPLRAKPAVARDARVDALRLEEHRHEQRHQAAISLIVAVRCPSHVHVALFEFERIDGKR